MVVPATIDVKENPIDEPPVLVVAKERVKRWELRRALKKISKETPERLRDVAFLRDRLLPAVALADDDLSQYPQFLHFHSYYGVRLWQFPIQFAPYLSAP